MIEAALLLTAVGTVVILAQFAAPSARSGTAPLLLFAEFCVGLGAVFGFGDFADVTWRWIAVAAAAGAAVGSWVFFKRQRS